MTVIQLVLIAFAGFGFGAVVRRHRRGGLSRLHLALWSLLWIAIIAVVVRPETASFLARRLGVGRGADVVIYLAVAVLFYLQFRQFGRLEDHERQITALTRELALKNLDEPHGP
jgi:hypothetical protein